MSCSEGNYDTDKLVTDQQRKFKRKHRSSYKHRHKQSDTFAMDRYKYDGDVPSNIRHQDGSKRTENTVNKSMLYQTGLSLRLSSKGKTKVPRSSQLRVNHQLKQRNHISQRRKMIRLRTNQKRTNLSRLNHVHLPEAAFLQLQSNNDQLTESTLSETTLSETTAKLSDNSSPSGALNLKDMPAIDSKEIRINHGERLISRSLFASKLVDINIPTVSGDSVGQLSSDWFNPKEYGCDSPV